MVISILSSNPEIQRLAIQEYRKNKIGLLRSEADVVKAIKLDMFKANTMITDFSDFGSIFPECYDN
ncbi:MAG: hypothetical protein V8R91_02100 [Butyricimonas faecihominis]